MITIIGQPASELRTFSRSFFWFGFLSGDRKKMNKEGINDKIENKKKEKFEMKAMSKSELADKAGVSVGTLMRWCKPFEDDLNAMGLQPNAKVLPPHIVKYLTEKLCIDT